MKLEKQHNIGKTINAVCSLKKNKREKSLARLIMKKTGSHKNNVSNDKAKITAFKNESTVLQ